MINLTSDVQLADPKMSKVALNLAIREAIQEQILEEAEQLQCAPGVSPALDKFFQPTFGSIFTPELKIKRQFSEAWLVAACTFAIESPPADGEPAYMDSVLFKKRGKLEIATYNDATGRTCVSRGAATVILSKRALRKIMLRLWWKGVVMLPFQFDMGRETYRGAMLTPVALFVANHPNKEIKTRCLRVILASNWHTFESVNLDDLSHLHILTLSGSGSAFSYHAGRIPFVRMLESFVEQFAENLIFTKAGIDIYSRWMRGKHYNTYQYDEFSKNYGDILNLLKNNVAQSREKSSRKARHLRRSCAETNATEIDFSKPVIHTILAEIASRKTHAAALEYYQACYGLNRGAVNLTPYPGREFIDLASLTRYWFPVISDYLDDRAASCYESNELQKSNLSILCDYLFLYLPWWQELYGATAIVALPLSIVGFERHVFLKSGGLPIEKSPLAIMEIGLRRTTSNSIGSLVSTLSSFFEYARGNKNKYPDLSGKVFDNPVNIKLDSPKKGRTGKTNKRTFKKKVMPYLLRYLYEIERFGIHLQQLQLSETVLPAIALNGNSPLPNKPTAGHKHLESDPSSDEDPYESFARDLPGIFYPDDFGIQLSVEFKEKFYPITCVPRIFQFSKRNIEIAPAEFRNIIIAHLSTLRIVIGIIETGLRGESIQWLDRRTWNHKNEDRPRDAPVVELWVNTDKVQEKPFAVPVIRRVQDLFQREQDFQLSCREDGMNNLVNYNGREKSRFDPIVPLFRARPKRRKGKIVGKPVPDGSYNKVWRLLLSGFQTFYNEEVLRDSDDYVQFVNLKPYFPKGINSAGHEIVIHDVNTHKPLYCPLRYVATHTPHSGRSTFISNRQSILSLEMIGSLVGQKNERTTEHYVIREQDEFEQQVETTSNHLWNFSSDDPAYIHAASVNSAMQRAFRKNPTAAIELHGFMTVSFLNGQDQEKIKDGIDLLRTTPADEFAWLDTNICPFGCDCPPEIMSVIKERGRCGLCPYAVKGIDHLPAISAKQQSLEWQVINSSELLNQWQVRAERGEIGPDLIERIDERRKLDQLEAASWRLAEQKLQVAAQQLNDAGENKSLYIVEQPEFVERFFTLVSKHTDRTQYVMDRLRDAHEFPALETPELRMEANQRRQNLLFNLKAAKQALAPISQGQEIELLFSTIRHAARSLGLQKTEIIRLLNNEANNDATGMPISELACMA